MPRFQTSIRIARPVEEVFGVLADVEKTAIWHPSAIEERWTSSGPVGVGSTRHSVGKAYGAKVENEAEVTVFQPNRALGLRSIDSPVPFEISIEFEAVDGETMILWTETLRPAGAYKPVVSLTEPLHRRQTLRGLARLNELMETGEL